MSRSRRKRPDPVVEHRRRMILQSVGLMILLLVAAVLVYKALQVP
ncbi:hypothetical protein [Nocardioides sp.]